MGYTHYFSECQKPKAIPERAVKIIKEILDNAYKCKLIQREFNDFSEPIVNNKEVIFNGVGEYGHETFHYTINNDNNMLKALASNEYFSFCKTARKPYDQIVMKVLIVLKCFIPTLRISSDGDFDKEWLNARKEMKERFNIVSEVNQDLVAYLKY